MAIGNAALENNTSGNNNTARGALALLKHHRQQQHRHRYLALENNTTGNNNMALVFMRFLTTRPGATTPPRGIKALCSNTTGVDNTAMGRERPSTKTRLASYNTANGYQALFHNTTGNTNTATGKSALLNNTTGSNNIAWGHRPGRISPPGATISPLATWRGGESNTIRIGTIGTQTATLYRRHYGANRGGRSERSWSIPTAILAR